jgi:hypothetical protein
MVCQRKIDVHIGGETPLFGQFLTLEKVSGGVNDPMNFTGFGSR